MEARSYKKRKGHQASSSSSQSTVLSSAPSTQPAVFASFVERASTPTSTTRSNSSRISSTLKRRRPSSSSSLFRPSEHHNRDLSSKHKILKSQASSSHQRNMRSQFGRNQSRQRSSENSSSAKHTDPSPLDAAANKASQHQKSSRSRSGEPNSSNLGHRHRTSGREYNKGDPKRSSLLRSSYADPTPSDVEVDGGDDISDPSSRYSDLSRQYQSHNNQYESDDLFEHTISSPSATTESHTSDLTDQDIDRQQTSPEHISSDNDLHEGIEFTEHHGNINDDEQDDDEEEEDIRPYDDEGPDLDIEEESTEDQEHVEDDEAEDDEDDDEDEEVGDGDEDDDDDDDRLAQYGFGGGRSGLDLSFLALSGMMSELASRCRQILESLARRDEDPSMLMISLQDLSEVLLVTPEDLLSAKLPVNSCAKYLVAILKDPLYEDSPEINLLACRCLGNLLSVLPSAASTVVGFGAVPILCQKLLEIQFIDVAEQSLLTLEKLSSHYSRLVLSSGGLLGCMSYLDFFSTSVQRTCMTIAANCCKHLSVDKFSTIKEVMPKIRDVLNGSDQDVVEQGCLCIWRIVENYKNNQDLLEELIDIDVIKRFLVILSPGASSVAGAKIHSHLFAVLSIVAKVSPTLSVATLDAGVGNVIYHILTNSTLVEDADQLKQDTHRQSHILQALIHKPADQIVGLLNLVSDLLPQLPFESELNVLVHGSSPVNSTPENVEINTAKFNLLNSHAKVVEKFLGVMLPTLMDVYSSTVNLTLRQRSLIPILKIIYSMDQSFPEKTLAKFDLCGFLGCILARKEHMSLVFGALYASYRLFENFSDTFLDQFENEGIVIEVIGILKSYKIQKKRKDKDKALAANSNNNNTTNNNNNSLRSEANARNEEQFTVSPRCARIAKKLLNLIHEHQFELRGTDENHANALDKMKQLASELVHGDSKQQSIISLKKYFNPSTKTCISGFQLIHSGILDALLNVLCDNDDDKLRQTFIREFMISHHRSTTTPFHCLTSKVQEALGRYESFEMRSSLFNEGCRDSSEQASFLSSKQIKIKLVNTDESLAAPLRNLIISAHAVGTFRTLDRCLKETLLMSGPGGHPARSSLTSWFPDFSDLNSGYMEDLAPGTLEIVPTSENERGEESRIENAAGEENIDEVSEDDEETQDFMDASDHLEERGQDDIGSSHQEHFHHRARSNDSDIHRIGDRDSLLDILRYTSPFAAGAFIGGSRRGGGYSRPRAWHFKYSIDGQPIDLDDSIYGVIFRNELENARQNPSSAEGKCVLRGDSSPVSRSMWHSVFTIEFKQIEGGDPAERKDKALAPSAKYVIEDAEDPRGIEKDEFTSKILKLLCVLHNLNSNGKRLLKDSLASSEDSHSKHMAHFVQRLSPDVFVNLKLTAKMNSLLEDPLIVTSGSLPKWSIDIYNFYGFVLPLDTRRIFLESTSFGYSRSFHRWYISSTNMRSSTQSSTSSSSSLQRRETRSARLGNIPRQKVKLSRSHMLESAIKLMESYASTPATIEIHYFDEEGTGLGPTLEFYSMVSSEFSKRSLKMWRDNDCPSNSEYAFGKYGLFPMPWDGKGNSSEYQRVLGLFSVLGTFVARALFDSRLLDFNFNPLFFQLANSTFEEEPSIAQVEMVDKHLAQSLGFLEKLTGNGYDNEVMIEDMALDFILPGFPDVELVEDGGEIPVTIDNVGDYIHRVVDFTVGHGVRAQINAFKEGFSKVFSYESMHGFSPRELTVIYGNGQEDWSMQVLVDTIKAEHGYTNESKSFKNLLYVMSEFNNNEKRHFLQFVTGSPNLPIGGFRALTPRLTVVLRSNEHPLVADDYLPSVMTCANYLKLPNYTSLDVLRERLKVAVNEGIGEFLLS